MTETNGFEIRQARTSAGGRQVAGVARALSELARQMQADPDALALLQHLVDAAVVNVPGTRWAAITLLEHGELSTAVQTAALPCEIDKLQYRLNEGPCVQSSEKQQTVVANDLRDELRWPEFARGAVQLGVLAMLSFQLFVEKASFGALNLYSDRPDAFDAESENIGLLLAAHAGVALAESRIESNLRIALSTRDVIGQAKGIIMERFKIGSQQAFEMLVYVSQRQNRKLREVAVELTETGGMGSP